MQREINKTSLPKIFDDLANIAEEYQRNFTETNQLHYLFRIFANIGAAKLPIKQELQWVGFINAIAHKTFYIRDSFNLHHFSYNPDDLGDSKYGRRYIR